MSEFAPKLEQHQALPEVHELLLPDAEHAEPLRPGEQDPTKAAAEARTTINETAQVEAGKALSESLQKAEGAQAAPSLPSTISRDLKAITVKRELKSLQRHESRPQRALSKIVHQPVVRKVSELADNTVSRPSGILGGGVIAFIGTSSYLWLAKHYGFEYNSFVFLALLTAGFCLGLLIELVVHLTLRRKHLTN